VESVEKKSPVTFTDLLRARFKGVLDPAGAFLNRLGLQPNTVTLFGLVGNTVAAYLLAIGHISWGGVVVLLMAPVDALDGTMARLRGKSSKFGAFVDSVTDRYSELVIMLGLLIHYTQQPDWQNVVLVYLAAAGSVLVSYVKARAESMGYVANIGLLSRVERFLVLIPALILNVAPIAMWIIAVLANGTAVQRIWHVRSQAREQEKTLPKS
jgi:CDP-diacylglycerol--glycerol-3-phosphate 3-phosphatidyltransferase